MRQRGYHYIILSFILLCVSCEKQLTQSKMDFPAERFLSYFPYNEGDTLMFTSKTDTMFFYVEQYHYAFEPYASFSDMECDLGIVHESADIEKARCKVSLAVIPKDNQRIDLLATLYDRCSFLFEHRQILKHPDDKYTDGSNTGWYSCQMKHSNDSIFNYLQDTIRIIAIKDSIETAVFVCGEGLHRFRDLSGEFWT